MTAGALRDGIRGLCLPGTVLNHDVNAEAVRSLGLDPQERIEVGADSDVVLASGDVFVTDEAVRARLAADGSALEAVTPLLDATPAQSSGRQHYGCRIAFGPDGRLFLFGQVNHGGRPPC